MQAQTDNNNIYDSKLTCSPQNYATHAHTRIARTALTLPSHTSYTIFNNYSTCDRARGDSRCSGYVDID